MPDLPRLSAWGEAVIEPDSRETLEAKLAGAERQLEQLQRTELEQCHWFYLSESQVQALANGDVTHELQLMFAYALDVMGELERNAARLPKQDELFAGEEFPE